MANKQTRVIVKGVDEYSDVIGGARKALSGLAHDAASAAAGFLIRDVVLGSWNKLTGAVQGFASELVGVNRRWETFNTQFYVQLGRSATATEARLAELEKFAVKTPFQLEGIIEADRALQVFGIHASNAAQRWGKSGSEIRTIAGDVAAGVGESFTEISQWLGRFSVGDTGLAIRRFEQMGITTRQELKAMGLEFSKAGELTSGMDQSMSVLLQVMERKFGGLMEIQSRTTAGMESNLKDFMTVQARLWGEPVFEGYKSGLSGLMSFLNTDGVQGMLGIGRDLFAAGVGWLGDMAREWAGGLAEIANGALYWGANIVDQFAAGITGSGAVSGALRNLADDITGWLAPGSPPKLLPNLDDWGEGAAEAWLEGWSGATPRIRPALSQIGRELQPFLDQISGGGTIEPGALRERFGPNAGGMEGYVASYAKWFKAKQATTAARGALGEAELGGDATTITGAREKLTLAEAEEAQAKRAMNAEQRKISDRLTAEERLLMAMRDQTKAVQDKEKAESDSAAKAAQRAAEAEQRAREQAYLQYRLTEAGTAGGQISIWEEELAKAEEGSAEFWNIKSRLIELQRKEAKEQGESIGESFAAGYEKTVAEIYGKRRDKDAAGGVLGTGIDWGGIGKSIGGALIDGIVAEAKSLPTKMLGWLTSFSTWAASPETRLRVGVAGLDLGRALGEGLRLLLGLDSESEKTKTSIVEMLSSSTSKALAGADQLLMDFGKGIGDAIRKGLADFNLGEWLIETLRDWIKDEGNRQKAVRSLFGLGAEEGPQSEGPAQPKYGQGGVYEGPEPPPYTVGGRASGGPAAGWTLVGEQGPELVNLPRGSNVTNAGDTKKALGGTVVNVAAGGIVINVANGSAREVQRGVLQALQRIGVPA